ncbi:MAG TPA: pentapeptide repeat-containing protein [Sedimentisphaerales bacterium]|nr:pentapeptide repeat-containing protein [Sedimentisphaerales bacterium]
MAKEDDGSKSEQERPQVRIGYKEDQYRLLKRCSDCKNPTEWNKWRQENPGEHISLPGAPLRRFWLREVNLQGANLAGAKLQNAQLNGAHLQGAFLASARLEGADFAGAHLQGAVCVNARLEGTDFSLAQLQGTDFSRVVVDGKTLIWRCEIDPKTKFEGVGLGNVRIYPETRQLLEYNIRRMNWEEWYKKHPKWKRLVKPFWLVSDYGMSTERIVLAFFAAAFVFANIYYHWGRLAPPGIVENLFVDGKGQAVQWWLVPLRTLYFSIVTQTTLGFGDMYARAQSIWGHILLSLQVILGYVLLGALVTRFAVLFTAGGPAGTFVKAKPEEETKGKEKPEDEQESE